MTVSGAHSEAGRLRKPQPSLGGEVLRGLLALVVVGVLLVGVLGGTFLLVARALPFLGSG